MLLQSDRHTAKDLQLWEEFERADALHAKTLDNKIADAMQCVTEFASTRECACSVSWGKDSMVVAHLCQAIGLPIVWVRWIASDNPDSERVCRAFIEQFPSANIVWLIAPDDDLDNGAVGFRKLSQLFPCRISGLRAKESTSRKISRFVHGIATEVSCRPIIDWSLQDVMSYLHRFNLPVHPVYAMFGSGRFSRKSLRVDSLGDDRGRGYGRHEWEQEYYGDVLNRMEAAKCLQK